MFGTKILKACALAGVIAGIGSQAAAMNCGPRDALTDTLNGRFGESRISGGLQGEDRLVEVYVSEERNTWTILVTQTNGTSCIVAAGTDWVGQTLMPAGIPG